MTPIEKLARELEPILSGLSNLEKALVLVAACREAYGADWVINARPNGGFSIAPAGGKRG